MSYTLRDFSGLTDLDLIEMQKQVREGEDDDFLHAVLVELGRRYIAHLEEDKEREEGRDGRGA